MKLNELLIPARAADLFLRVRNTEIAENEGDGEKHFKLSESLLEEMFLQMGAIPPDKVNENEFGISLSGSQTPVYFKPSENMFFTSEIPDDILQIMEEKNCNIVRAVMLFKNLSLKEIADLYGGASGASNVANFMAKSEDEMRKTRPSTLKRLAKALGCPEAWLLKAREGSYKVTEEKAEKPKKEKVKKAPPPPKKKPSSDPFQGSLFG